MELSYLFKELKKNNIFGDYILAARLNYPYNNDLYGCVDTLILGTINWDSSPQGYRFWQRYYTEELAKRLQYDKGEMTKILRYFKNIDA